MILFTVLFIVNRSFTCPLWLHLQYYLFFTDPVHFLCDSVSCLCVVFFIVYRSCTFSLWLRLQYHLFFTDPVFFLCDSVNSNICFLQILYIFFVALFTYFLLVDYQFYEITTIEIVCIVWIFTFIVDELYTVSLHTFPATYSHWKVLAVKVVFKLVVENAFSMVKQYTWVLNTWMHD